MILSNFCEHVVVVMLWAVLEFISSAEDRRAISHEDLNDRPFWHETILVAASRHRDHLQVSAPSERVTDEERDRVHTDAPVCSDVSLQMRH